MKSLRGVSVSASRGLASSAARCGRPLELRPPVDPKVSDVAAAQEHPLWQFFHNQQLLRKPSELKLGNSWTVPQLRRKNFDDLHTLWYACLKERNVLGRESQIIKTLGSLPGRETDPSQDANDFDNNISKIKQTMVNIRRVLAERYHSQLRAQEQLSTEYPKLLAEFSREFLEADSNADAEVAGQMERFQYAFYGINPFLQDNIPNSRVITGLYAMAKLKLQRYAGESEVADVRDIREAFLLFTCEHTPEGVQQAVETILEVRKVAEPIEDESEVLAQLMFDSQAEPEMMQIEVDGAEGAAQGEKN